MSLLERAVADLADALDTLEAKVGDRVNNHDSEAASRQTRTARQSAQTASDELRSAIKDLRALLGEKQKG